MEKRLTSLVTNLTNDEADEAINLVPYYKGALMLDYLEELVGGPGMVKVFIIFNS